MYCISIYLSILMRYPLKAATLPFIPSNFGHAAIEVYGERGGGKNEDPLGVLEGKLHPMGVFPMGVAITAVP